MIIVCGSVHDNSGSLETPTFVPVGVDHFGRQSGSGWFVGCDHSHRQQTTTDDKTIVEMGLGNCLHDKTLPVGCVHAGHTLSYPYEQRYCCTK